MVEWYNLLIPETRAFIREAGFEHIIGLLPESSVSATFDQRGKMKPKWFRPSIIKKIMSGGAKRITYLDGVEMLCLFNMDRL